MHRNPVRKDIEATKAAGFLSRYSYVSFRVHPRSDHCCVYLAGDDCEIERRRVFDRDGYRCVDCGVGINIFTGELDHIGGNTKVTRCWCPEALMTRCHDCHVRRHGRVPRWTRKEKP